MEVAAEEEEEEENPTKNELMEEAEENEKKKRRKRLSISNWVVKMDMGVSPLSLFLYPFIYFSLYHYISTQIDAAFLKKMDRK